jgi:hypothetical protein
MEMPYNFISIPDKAFNLWKRGLDYTVDNHNFILFTLLLVVGFPLCMIITTPILLLAGIEHLLYTIMDYLDEVGDENKFKSYMSYTGIIIMLVPTLIFFGPGLIYHSIKKHMEKKESALNREMEMTIERIRCNNREMERLQRYTRRNRVEDFKPKKYLVPHNFRKGKVIIPGVYIEGNMSTASGYNSIAIGHNNTVAGYYNNNGQPNRIRYE